MASDESAKPLQYLREAPFYFVLIVVTLAAFVVPYAVHAPGKGKHTFAKSNLKQLSAAMEAYHDFLGAFPPDNVPGSNNGEVLFALLCQKINDSEGRQFGPFIVWNQSFIEKSPNGNSRIFSPNSCSYVYKIIHKDGKDFPLIIDPGPDKLLGGTIDPEKGFVPDNSDANHDGVPDDQDNITNETGK